jgi:hypothetical protein
VRGYSSRSSCQGPDGRPSAAIKGRGWLLKINSLAPAGTAAPTTAPATSRFTPTTTRPAPTTTATTTRPAPAPDPDPEPDRDRDRRAPAPAPTAARKKDDDNDSGGGSVYYKNCAAVRAAGKAPIRSGDPGYRPGLDSDGDGQGCAQD